MKRLALLVFACSLGVVAPASAQSDAEIAKIRKVLADGSARFMKIIETVTDDQWSVRVSGIAHTIGEEVEHIALSENDLLQIVDRALQKEAEPGASERLADKEGTIHEIMLGEDATAERFKYKDKIADRRDFMEYYPPAHERLMQKLDSSADLGQHVYRHPNSKIGELTGVQWFYYVAYHRERHVRQIEAILAHPDLPGSHQSAD